LSQVHLSGLHGVAGALAGPQGSISKRLLAMAIRNSLWQPDSPQTREMGSHSSRSGIRNLVMENETDLKPNHDRIEESARKKTKKTPQPRPL
jgi:hypothetical protein